MRVLVDIGHPAHAHFFRNAIVALRQRGHVVHVSSRDKDVTLDLLRLFGIEAVVLSRVARTRAGLYFEYVMRLSRLAALLRRCQPDVVTAIGGVFVAPAGRLAHVPSVVFTDTEHVALDRWLTYPLATRICTPYTFLKDLGPSQRRYHGFHELAYLGPNRFRPGPSVREELGLDATQRFVVMRLVSWGAGHDQGHSGLSPELCAEAVQRLSRHARVFVCAEGALTPSLRPFALRLPSHRIHDALAEASLYVGEGATMATEAGLLGTPSLYVSSLVGTMGNFERLRQVDLVESFTQVGPALDRADSLLSEPNAKRNWHERAVRFAENHIDMTAFVVGQLTEVARVSRPVERDRSLDSTF